MPLRPLGVRVWGSDFGVLELMQGLKGFGALMFDKAIPRLEGEKAFKLTPSRPGFP